MKFDITEEKYNPFLKRKEVMLTLEHPEEPTPPKAGFQALLAKHLDTEQEKIEVVDIFSEHGRPFSRARVFVWDEKRMPAKEEKKEAKQEPATA